MKSALFIFIASLALILSACATTIDDSGSTINTSDLKQINCEDGYFMKVDGKKVQFTVEDSSIPNPSTEILNGHFNAAVIRKEGGLFELVGFDSNKLNVGVYSGDDFRLLLINSGFQKTACTDEDYKNESILVIQEYITEGDTKLSGCYAGTLNCNGTIVEFQSLFDGSIPESVFYTTN
ncbi:MAG: hypothetical protein GF329_14910 [Candidatus Lokiarchaeota archaeon]|nr:hypothetical protein [Candidatus Lokiarchaeota archaeon]